MKLSALLQDVENKSMLTSDPEITGVTDSTEKIRRGCAFVCIAGDKADGHDFAAKALEKGATVVVCQRELEIRNSIIVDDTRKAYALMCAAFYGNCSRKMRIIGITGTNGKTTTSFLLRSILEDAGIKTGLMGTVNVEIGKEKYPADLTTPDPADLHRYLMLMHIAGCEACVMEVSSQSLVQQRVYGIEFDCGVFTNLSPEHLDYHKTFEDYCKAKQILFKNCRKAVINGDSDFAQMMKSACKGGIVTYGTDEKFDFSAKNIQLDKNGVKYTLTAYGVEYKINYPMTGSFSVYNSMAALSTAHLSGADIKKSAETLATFSGIEGRMEKLPNTMGINIIIDFAHTPDSLLNALKTLRSVYNGRLITVFGCGGDRDKQKRPAMGKIACENSDVVFVTSDNPRTENPEAIIRDITGELEYKNYHKITDRTMALKSAVSCAKRGDTILVAGKGHEKYQIMGTQKIYYNEREIIKRLLEDKARFEK